MSKKILVIAAHPDDEVLGCGATISRLILEGNTAYTLILGEGITSRDITRDQKKRNSEINRLKNNIKQANKILGIEEVITYNLPDNRFDSVDFLDIVKIIENVKNEIKPDIIFTHYINDLNIDHSITAKAVMTATRPLDKETVKTIYSFEILSSTEWNYPLTFSPNIYYNVSETINLKIEAMKKYKSEIRDFPHPRSIEGIKIKSQQRGSEVGFSYAEAFCLVRSLK